MSFSLLTNFASPEKRSMQGICSPSQLPNFAILPFTSTHISFHCFHVENTKQFWWNVQTFLSKDVQPHHHIFQLRMRICHTCSLVLVQLWEILYFWESTLSCKHDNLWYEFSDRISWPKGLINLLLRIN